MYGTNGVILQDIDGYPSRGIRLGLYNPNDETFEVDFVGHSWFFKREYLNWMLAKTYKDRYKYVGEDMCLSYACLEHGVKTFVPLHPKEIYSLWGSIPTKYEDDISVAISSDLNNWMAMANALQEMHNDGWKFLFERNSAYINYVKQALNRIANERQKIQLTNNINAIFKLFGKKPPAFLGDKNYAPAVQNLFAIVDADYCDVANEKNVLNFRPYALNIFFTEKYPYIKPFLEQNGFKEYEHFIDGRLFLRLV